MTVYAVSYKNRVHAVDLCDSIHGNSLCQFTIIVNSIRPEWIDNLDFSITKRL